MLNNYGEVINDASLKEYNTYRIDTKCKYLIKVTNVSNLVELINYLNDNNIKYLVLGKGSNVILPDTPFNGAVISLEKLNKITIEGNKVICEAGVNLVELVNKVINHNLSGLEYLGGIPGTLGGALYGNAGVKEHCIYDHILSVDVIRCGKLITLDKKDIIYSYRNSMFKDQKDLIISGTFLLKKELDNQELLQIIKEERLKRQNTQPLEYPNAGSVFKNPVNNYAGKLIEECQLKGYNINDAYVSLKHANFIINKGHATSKDIKELISYIQDKVYKEKNILLELEQIIIDWD